MCIIIYLYNKYLFIGKYNAKNFTYKKSLFNGRSEVDGFGSDEGLHSQRYSETSPLDYFDCFVHGRKTFRIESEVAAFGLPQLVQQDVTWKITIIKSYNPCLFRSLQMRHHCRTGY